MYCLSVLQALLPQAPVGPHLPHRLGLWFTLGVPCLAQLMTLLPLPLFTVACFCQMSPVSPWAASLYVELGHLSLDLGFSW